MSARGINKENHGFSITDSAQKQIETVLAEDIAGEYFRVAVNGGGCSGFQYEFGIADKVGHDDIIIEKGNAKVLVDLISIPFLKDAKLDWVDDLIGSSFRIKNPNAKSSCGCGVSFSV